VVAVSRDFDSFDPPEANPDVRAPARRGGRPARGPGAFVWASVRMGWRWLTRMRTALYLLAALGVLSLVATVIPQEPNVPATVADWRAGVEGPGQAVATLLDGLGAFDMYGAPVFLALLMLLFLSLTACLIPRVRAWWRLTRHGRPPATRHLDRHPQQAAFATERTPDEVQSLVRAELRGRRFRLRAPEAGAAASADRVDVAAEKGIVSREGGSLAFHLSFYVLLVAIVLGQLLGFQGQVGVVEGRAFTDTQLAYWNTTPGRWWDADDHRAFTLQLDQFNIDWVRDPRFAGTPSLFQSDVTVTRPDGSTVEDTVGGNDPLVVDGMKIHQLEWGYAPRVVVEVDGEVVHDAFLTATQTNRGFFRSAVKAPRPEPDVGLGVQLYPTAVDDEGNVVIDRGLPWADAPLLLVDLFRGDLQLDRAQNVNQLDTTGLDLVDGQIPIAVGQTFETEDGVRISFPELRRWVGFQVSNRPTTAWLLLGALLMLVGLVPALYAYRRRVWVRAERGPDGGTLVQVAGRAFQRPQAFEDEFADLVERLRRATGTADGPPGDEPPTSPSPDRSDAHTLQGDPR
jgi:cytochrome c biogenesis protein